jgi:hypothetical protein
VSQQDIRHRLSLHVPWENHIRHRLSLHVPSENLSHHHHHLVNHYGIPVAQIDWFCVSFYNPIMSIVNTCQQVCNNRNTTGVIIGAETAYSSRKSEFTPVFSGAHSLVFCVIF